MPATHAQSTLVYLQQHDGDEQDRGRHMIAEQSSVLQHCPDLHAGAQAPGKAIKVHHA